jgi:hypothetical protein
MSVPYHSLIEKCKPELALAVINATRSYCNPVSFSTLLPPLPRWFDLVHICDGSFAKGMGAFFDLEITRDFGMTTGASGE